MENVRKKYRVLSLFIMVVLACSIILIFTYHMMRIMELYLLQGEQSIREEKEFFIKNGVDSLITDMEDAKQMEYELHEGLCAETAVHLSRHYMQTPEHFLELAIDYFSIPENQVRYDVIIEDTNSGQVLYHNGTIKTRGSLSQYEWTSYLKNTLSTYHHRTYGEIEVYWGTDASYLAEKQKIRVMRMIETSQYPKDRILWVGEVKNFEGGPDFAVLLYDSLHPYSADRLLSTADLDADGRAYFQKQLEVIKEKGQGFLNLSINERKRNQVDELLTYFRFYPEYNLVVTMGTEIMDRDDFDRILTEKRIPIIKTMAVQIVFALLTIMAVAIFAQILIEKWYYNKAGKKLTEQVNQDPLTKIFNRRGAMSCLEATYIRYREIDENAAIVMLDVDHFKKINDAYGHEFGDQVLVRTTDAIQKHIRSTDMLARWGGEEFLLICPGLKPEYVEYFVKKILDAVGMNEYHAGEDDFHVTVSLGISFYEPDDTEYSAALKRADLAMYRAKENGRNQAAFGIDDDILYYKN